MWCKIHETELFSPGSWHLEPYGFIINLKNRFFNDHFFNC